MKSYFSIWETFLHLFQELQVLEFTLLLINRSLTIINFLISFIWSLLFGFAVYYSNSIIIWQNLYFYIICYYLKIKIKGINNEIRAKLDQNISLKDIAFILSKLDSISVEINTYNDQFWSHYIALLNALFITQLSTFLYTIIYGENDPIIKFMFAYAFVAEM